MTSAALCLGPCRPVAHGGPRQPMPGFALCDVCEERAAEGLHWIADNWHELEKRLGVVSAPQIIRAPSPDRGLSINEDVLQAMDAIRADLRYWTRVILDENAGFAGPKARTFPGLARYVAVHIKQLTRNHDERLAVFVAVEVNEHRRMVRRLAFPSGARKFEPGIPCFEHATSDTGERVPCPGEYRVYITDRVDTLPDLTCSKDRSHTLEPSAWRRVRKVAMNPVAVLNLVQTITQGGAS